MSQREESGARTAIGALLLSLLVVGLGAIGNTLHHDAERIGTLVGMILGLVVWFVILWFMTPGPPKRDPHPSPDEVR